jgi:hypothetical protein
VGAGALPQASRERERERERDRRAQASIFHTRFSFTKWRAICQTPQDKQPVERVGRTGCMLTAPLSISIQTDHLKPFVHSFTRQSVKGELIGHKLIRAAARTPQISRRLFLALPPERCFCSFIGFYVDTHSLLSSVCGCNE